MCLHLAAASGTTLGLSFDYGQRNRRELRSASAIADHLGCEHLVVNLDMRRWGGSALTSDETVPAPDTGAYVPARNLVFTSVAFSIAEARGADFVYLGVGAHDLHHPDTRPAFLRAMQNVADVALLRSAEHGRPVCLRAPLAGFDRPDIVRIGRRLGAPLGLTWSCYEDGPRPCQTCGPCRVRRVAFDALGLVDPASSDG